MREDRLPEGSVGAGSTKRHPVRRNIRKLGKRGGITRSSDTLRLIARIVARDLLRFEDARAATTSAGRTQPLLKLSDGSDRGHLSKSMTLRLGPLVESAMVEQIVEIDETRSSHETRPGTRLNALRTESWSAKLPNY